MLRAGHPYYVMDLHTSIDTSGYFITSAVPGDVPVDVTMASLPDDDPGDATMAKGDGSNKGMNFPTTEAEIKLYKGKIYGGFVH